MSKESHKRTTSGDIILDPAASLREYEQLKLLAIEMRARMDAVIQTVEKQIFPNEVFIKKELAPGIVLVKGGNHISLISERASVEGIGKKSVTFQHHIRTGAPEVEQQTLLPLETALELDVHRDENTIEQVRALTLTQPDAEELLGTLLSVDRDYNFHKLSYIPLEIADARPALYPSALPRKLVRSRMRPEDLQEANALLERYQSALGSKR